MNDDNVIPKKPFLKMTDEIAIELVRQWIKVGEQPLGIPFGWIQPDNDDYCTLGDVYTQYFNQNLLDVLFNEVYDYAIKGYKLEAKYSLDQTKRVLRILKSNNKNLRTGNIQLKNDVIFNLDHVTTQFSKLDSTEKCLYRMSILVLNTMTEGHNFAIEYLNYLAHNYITSADYKSFQIYENSLNGYKSEIMEILAENPENLDIQLEYESPEYNINYLKDKYPDSLDYLMELEYQFDDDKWAIDIINYVFNVNCKYDREEILTFLAWCIGWIREEYQQGYITFKYTENVDSKILRDWLYTYENQLTLDIE
jgi:hypothetical protein